ncbi:hypothetical protein H0H92_002864 [Tricholoma furcatifolium]|nr:hypothetical protein H0H92_002864 [Tricholoma furcatifolium]
MDYHTDPNLHGAADTEASRATATLYIQGRIKYLESQVRFYRRHSNALTGVCRLPPEILSAVFIEVAKDAESASRKLSLHHDQQIHWVRVVSHVSSQWRNVALSTPTIWTNIPIGYPTWAMEMLRRSKNAPLTVAYRGHLNSYLSELSARCYTILWEILHSHLHRLEHFTLRYLQDGSTTQAFNELIALLAHPSSAFKHFELSCPISVVLRLPQTLWSSQHLQRLILENVTMPWESVIFEQLKTLEISGIRRPEQPSIQQILSVLSRSPSLEELSVADIKPLCMSADMVPLQIENLETIELRCLRKIVLSCDLASWVLLFDNVILSNMRTIVIQLKPYPERTPRPPERAISSVERIAQKLDRSTCGSLSKLELMNRLRCWKPKDFRNLEPTIEIDLRNIDRGEIAWIGEPFWQSFTVDGIVSLTVTTHFNISEDRWNLFGDLCHLEELIVYRQQDIVIKVLRRGTILRKSKRRKTVPRPSFAKLRRLEIVKWDMADVVRNRTSGQRLVDCLKLRKRAGLQLECLKLERLYRFSDDSDIRFQLQNITGMEVEFGQ